MTLSASKPETTHTSDVNPSATNLSPQDDHGACLLRQGLTRRGLLGAAATLTLAAALPGRASSSWREAPALPMRIQEIYPCLHQGSLWVAGGLSPDAPASASNVADRVMRFELATQTWHEAGTLPAPRHHGFLVSVGQSLLLFGGFVIAAGGRWRASREILRYEVGTWVPVGVLPSAQSETVVAVANDQVHLAGGRAPYGESNAQWSDQRDMAMHHVFDPTAATTMTAAALPMARNSAASFLIDDQWHVVGGRTVDGGNTDRHDVYDLSEGRWRTAAPMPQAQGGLAAASIGRQGFVFGGEFFSDSGGGVYSEVWGYDTMAEAWRQADVMPVPRHGLGAVAVGSEIYVIGGATAAGGNGTSARMSVYTP